MMIFHIGLLCSILVITPLLLVRRFFSDIDAINRLTAIGILAILLTLGAALGLHATRIPITVASLTIVHLVFLAIALCVHVLPLTRATTAEPLESTSSALMGLLIPAILLMLLLFPYTHFTGIDTYKWQDLATSVRMEQSLPWIVHPLSLLGFTPRAYPPAHPVLLATVQILGNLGVEGGFAVVSLFIAFLGLASSTALARRLLSPNAAAATGILYVFSPVFIRYAHWATGRGLFLAIFPAFIAVLLPLDDYKASAGCVKRFYSNAIMRRFFIIFTLAMLLLLTHKVALVAVPLTLLAAFAVQVFPRRLPNSVRIVMTLPFLAVATAIVSPAMLGGPAGLALGLLRTGVMRYAWMFPFAIAGLWLPSVVDSTRGMTTPRGWNIFLLGALPAIVLAFERQMYGALYALPFVCIFAVVGFNRLTAMCSPRMRRAGLIIAAGLTILGAYATVLVRSQIATTPELYAAAMFLEEYDPQGPFTISAPGIARTRIQAYVSGCARFEIRTNAHSQIQWASPPLKRMTLRATVDAWGSWLRSVLKLSDTETSWYGNPCRHYHFIIDREGSAPSGAALIYERDGIAIYEATP